MSYEATRSLVFYLLGSSGYKPQADVAASVSRDIIDNPQVIEGIASYQSPHFFRTRLMHAVKKRDVERVKLLVELGADIHARDRDGNTALYYAILCGHLEIFQFLCDKGAALDTSNEIGLTSLHYTSLLGTSDIAEILINKGVSLDSHKSRTTALTLACENGRDKIVRLLCEAGAGLDLVGYRGATGLHYASGRGFSKIVQLLCDYGATLDQENYDRETPVELACMNGHLDVVRILSAAGAVLDQSHLYNAICKGDMELVCFLLETGISPHHYWRIAPRTFLHAACEQGHYNIVSILIDAGMILDAVSRDEETPLILACKGGYTKIVRLLITNGAGLDLQDKYGHTALHTICDSHNIRDEKDRNNLVNILMDAGAISDLKAFEGSTPFSIASRKFSEHPRNPFQKALVVYFANLDSQA